MTNAVGYYHIEREERINTASQNYMNNPKKLNARAGKRISFDINRDFPYNTQPK